MHKLPVWDLPTRLFHWLLVAGIASAYVTGEIGGNLIEWHGRAGLFVIGLIVFRIVWGFVGAPTARFSHFLRGPGAIKAYLKGHWQGVGHNPLGALAVLALLLLVAAQAGTGLFTNDDISFEGPLAGLVGKELSDRLLGLHVRLQVALLVLVGIHFAAIAFYALVKRKNLVRPMITGWDHHAPGSTASPHHPPRPAARSLAAFVLALGVAAGSVYVVAGGVIGA